MPRLVSGDVDGHLAGRRGAADDGPQVTVERPVGRRRKGLELRSRSSVGSVGAAQAGERGRKPRR